MEVNDAREIAEKAREAETPEQPKAIKYIENPLPLPKKHVKRELDYQYQVPEDKMKFDVEIPYGDDFDI